MTKSVYIVGGAGTGKSTFTAALLNRIGHPEFGPSGLQDLYSKPNSRGTVITLRGHEITDKKQRDGLYLGCLRESFPGTDGLDRVSYIPGEEWLTKAELPSFIIGEGATLSVRRFLYALEVTTDLLLVHLTTDDMLKELRLDQRGANQDASFITSTATRSRNLAVELAKVGVKVWDVDTGEPEEWDQALHIVEDHLA